MSSETPPLTTHNTNNMEDTDLMPFGKFKGNQMIDVPAWHLLWLLQNGCSNPNVKAYIIENKDVLEKEQKENAIFNLKN